MKVTVYKQNDANCPKFPDNFKILAKAVLQKTDIAAGKNNNKYYCIEIHGLEADPRHRVFTHYGRTDDLETKGADAGVKECRFFKDYKSARAEYERIYIEKTGSKKGYKELALASSKVGSQASRGMSSGHVDDETKKRIEAKDAPEQPPVPPPSTLPAGIRALVTTLYQEATGALTASTAKVNITAKGVETPLGILTIGQIEKGETILKGIHTAVGAGSDNEMLSMLSSNFYSAIPHKIGRTRDAVAASVIRNLETVVEKQELLQLMRDMLIVSGDKADTLVTDDVDQKYKALGCDIVEITDINVNILRDYVLKTQVHHKATCVHRVYAVKRHGEHEAFMESIGNKRKLFHGSRARNWMGLLSRGILLPKIVQAMGVHRTDAGWLGHGIYFGDVTDTSYNYTSPTKAGTRFMAIAEVALGNMRDYVNITYGLSEPPTGYDSCHGVRRKSGVVSQFDDDEYVIYKTNQQKMLYLVELS